jgi:hypothetical protein
MDDGQRWEHDEVLHAWWVEPGRLLAGEYPGAKTPERRRSRCACSSTPESINRRPHNACRWSRLISRGTAGGGGEMPDGDQALPIRFGYERHRQEGYDRILVRIRGEMAPAESFTSMLGWKGPHLHRCRLPSH